MNHLSTRIKRSSSNKTCTNKQTGTELRAELAQRLHELTTQSKIKTPASEWHPEALGEQPWVQAKNKRIAKVIPEDVSPRNHGIRSSDIFDSIQNLPGKPSLSIIQ
jgi:hypothetical protein